MYRVARASLHGILIPVLVLSLFPAVSASSTQIAQAKTVTESRDEAESPEIYVSTDIEADGPIPGPNSMLSLGSAAFTAEGEMIATFSANLHPLEGAQPHPDTMAWWRENQAAWEATRTDLRDPQEAISEYVSWLESLPGKPVFVGYPAAFDYMFVKWYLMHFVGHSPFGHAALDIRSYAMATLGVPWGDTTKSGLPKRWIPESPHTHVALDDAIEQGQLFCNMLAERQRGRQAE